MMNLNKARAAALALMASAVLLAACKKEEPPQQQPVAPSANQSSYVEQPKPLRPDQLNLAAGAQFPPERVPVDEASARAIARLASAFATGDAETLRSLLDRADVSVLDHLIESGQWRDSTNATQVVRVCAVESKEGALRVGLGFEDDEGAYLLAFEGVQARGDWKFKAIPVPSPSAARAADLDGAPIN